MDDSITQPVGVDTLAAALRRSIRPVSDEEGLPALPDASYTGGGISQDHRLTCHMVGLCEHW